MQVVCVPQRIATYVTFKSKVVCFVIVRRVANRGPKAAYRHA